MPDIDKKEFIHKILGEVQSAVNAIGDVDPDIHEKLDEVVLAIYDQFDVSFKRCQSCEDDVLVETVTSTKGKDYCRNCRAQYELANADTQDVPFTKA